jgi:methionyl-tRNA formyltransferase
MKIIFFGTPAYVLPILKEVGKSVVAVVTQPPKVAGREKFKTYSAVDNWAHKRKVPVFYNFDNLPSADLGITAAYGQIIPESVIKNLKFGILNVHPSLLPKFRGASPIQAAIVSGEKETGVTVIKMDRLVDHGPIVSSFKDEIKETDSNETLRSRLFERSSKFIRQLIPAYIDGKIRLKEQDHSKATFTTLIRKEDGFVPPKILQTALEGKPINQEWKLNFLPDYLPPYTCHLLERFIRAMYPWPIAWTFISLPSEKGERKKLKIIKSHAEGERLALDTVQLEGKNPVSWRQFKEGHPNYKLI